MVLMGCVNLRASGGAKEVLREFTVKRRCFTVETGPHAKEE
jgi:hypothetical protein